MVIMLTITVRRCYISYVIFLFLTFLRLMPEYCQLPTVYKKEMMAAMICMIKIEEKKKKSGTM